MIQYRVYPYSPEAHIFRIELKVPGTLQDGCVLSMAAWIPGSYMIRDFARNIIALKAASKERELKVTKLDKQTWKVERSSTPVTITYDVYAYDLSVRGAYLDIVRGFITGTSLFLKVAGKETEACLVDFYRPDGPPYIEWQLATTLEGVGTDFLEFGQYRAANFEELIDHPVEMGNFEITDFTLSNTPHSIQISGIHNTNTQRLCVDLEKICSQHISMFGELPEMKRYLFQVLAVGEGYGGLEHRSSTSLICNRNDLPGHIETEVSEGYRRFLGLCSHEYFHLWNVKRIRPEALKQSDLSSEAHTTLLWAFEGITSYYDDLALVRSGVIDQSSYLDLLARMITSYLRGSGRFKQSVAQSSFDAWTKFYKQDENAPNAIVSYYIKGALIALLLDLKLRRDTEGEVSLDSVMRELWTEYGREDKGLAEKDIELITKKISGIELDDFFNNCLYDTVDLPLEEYLASVGIGMSITHAEAEKAGGGVLDKRPPVKEPVPSLGIKSTTCENGIKIVTADDNGAAQKAGMSAGDTIIAVNGVKADTASHGNLLSGYKIDDQLCIHAFRRDELMVFQVRLQAAAANICHLWLDSGTNVLIKNARKKWLASSTEK